MSKSVHILVHVGLSCNRFNLILHPRLKKLVLLATFVGGKGVQISEGAPREVRVHQRKMMVTDKNSNHRIDRSLKEMKEKVSRPTCYRNW